MNIPCKTCKPPRRHPGCHDTCEDYKQYHDENERIKEKRRGDAFVTDMTKSNLMAHIDHTKYRPKY